MSEEKKTKNFMHSIRNREAIDTIIFYVIVPNEYQA